MPNVTPLRELIAPELEFLDSATSQGGNRRFVYVHCKSQFNGSQTRQVAHLLGIKNKGIAVCKEIPEVKRLELQAAHEEVLAQAAGPSSSSGPASKTGVCHKLNSLVVI